MLKISFNPFPCLESDRLYLRQITIKDVNEVFELRSSAEIMKYIPRPLAKTKHDALDFIDLINKAVKDNEGINWAITLKKDNVLIGMICLIRMQPQNFRSEIGYILHPDLHGKGIMHEAAALVIDYAFNALHFHSLEAVIDPENRASANVLLKHGFVKEGYFKESGFYEGRFLDAEVYSLLNTKPIPEL